MSKKNDLKGAYGIKSINEMLAELSSPEFRTLVKEGGFWKVLLNALKRMFGIETQYNAELKELDDSVDDLETINMWAELSDVSNAASTTLNRTPETTTISRSDITKIIKDAETAIENEQKLKISLKVTFYSNAELAVRNIKQTDNQGKEVKYSVKDKRKSAPETVSVLKEHLQTAISSTDGTKVLKNIDSTIDKYENVKRANAFLGDLANAIGAKKRGGGCERN